MKSRSQLWITLLLVSGFGALVIGVVTASSAFRWGRQCLSIIAAPDASKVFFFALFAVMSCFFLSACLTLLLAGILTRGRHLPDVSSDHTKNEGA
jgi:hypothetical protein